MSEPSWEKTLQPQSSLHSNDDSPAHASLQTHERPQARIPQLKMLQIHDPQKLWNNQCFLLFQATKLWGVICYAAIEG